MNLATGWRVRAGAIGTEISAGLVASLLPLANCFTFAALIFSGPWLFMLNQGVVMLLSAGAVTGVVVVLTSGFRVAVAAPISITSAMLAALMVRLDPLVAGQPQSVVAATGLAALFAATLVTGLALLALGGLRLGRMVRFTPFPVIAGFMGATGWLMTDGAVRMTTGLPLTLAALPRFAEPQAALRLMMLVGFMAVLLVLSRRFRHPLTIPAVLIAAAVAMDGGLRWFGISLADARVAGLLFDVTGTAAPSIPLLSGALVATDWHAILAIVPGLAPVAVLAVVQVLVTAASLEVTLDTQVDFDRELRSQGLANVASVLAGGVLSLSSTVYTAANTAAHGRGRLSVLIVAGVLLVALWGGSAILSVVPRAVLGSMLLMLGVDLLFVWSIASRRRMAWHEWSLTLATIAITAVFGVLPALLTGLVGSCVLLAVSMSRFGVVRHRYSLNEAASSLDRSEAEMLALSSHRDGTQVIEVSGFLFFGSAHQLQAQVQALLASRPGGMLILDFAAVIGIDSSAQAVLARIRSLVAKAETALIVSGVRADAAAWLAGPGAPATVCHTLDEALEVAENRLLSALGVAAPTEPLEQWLTAALRSRESAHILYEHVAFAPYAAGDVLCREGDVADSLYFVAEGRLSVTVDAPPRPVRLRVFGPHTVAGELGFFLDTLRTATLRVEGPALIGQLSREAFRALGESHPAVVAALLEYLARVQAERLANATRQVVALRR